jgi:tetratricopeptide (TPR) repeat protein
MDSPLGTDFRAYLRAVHEERFKQELDQRIATLDMTPLIEVLATHAKRGEGPSVESLQRGYEQLYHRTKAPFPDQATAFRAMLVTFLEEALLGYQGFLYPHPDGSRRRHRGPVLEALLDFIQGHDLVTPHLMEKLELFADVDRPEDEVQFSVKMWTRQGLAHYHSRRRKEAQALLQQALLWNPRDAFALNCLGQLYTVWDREDQAAEIFRVVTQSPHLTAKSPEALKDRRAFAFNALGRLAIGRNDLDAATTAFVQGLTHAQSTDTKVFAWLRLGRIALARQEYLEASSAFRTVLALPGLGQEDREEAQRLLAHARSLADASAEAHTGAENSAGLEEAAALRRLVAECPELTLVQERPRAPRMLVLVPVGRPVLEALAELPVTVLMIQDSYEPPLKLGDRYVDLIRQVDPTILWTFVNDPVPPAILDLQVTPSLRWIVHMGQGYDGLFNDETGPILEERDIGVTYIGHPWGAPAPSPGTSAPEGVLRRPSAEGTEAMLLAGWFRLLHWLEVVDEGDPALATDRRLEPFLESLVGEAPDLVAHLA